MYFLKTSKEAIDFGVIDIATATALAIPHGPIRLLSGDKNFGHAHVTGNTDRMRKLLGLGFHDFCVFAELVAENYTEIAPGDPADRQIIIHHHRGYGLRLILQPISDKVDGFYWSIVTGIPGRKSQPGGVYTVLRQQPAATTQGPAANTTRPILTLKKTT